MHTLLCSQSEQSGHVLDNQLARKLAWKQAKDFVLSYDTCSRSKNPQHRLHGLLQSLPILNEQCSLVSKDFITYLGPSSFFDTMYVIIDQLTKIVCFVSCNKKITKEESIKFFLDNIHWYYGLLVDII